MKQKFNEDFSFLLYFGCIWSKKGKINMRHEQKLNKKNDKKLFYIRFFKISQLRFKKFELVNFLKSIKYENFKAKLAMK